MMRVLFWALLGIFVVYIFYPVVIKSNKFPLLILNTSNEETLPRNFRLTTKPLEVSKDSQLSIEGLNTLNASGSAQFSEKGLQAIAKNIPTSTFTIVDLREESHGFINGAAVSWYGNRDWANINKSLNEIELDEQKRLQKALDQHFVLIYFSKKFPVPFYVKSISTEAQLAKSLNFGYIRIPVRDHVKPTDSDVDSFIKFVRSLPAGTWLHFHCAAGEGRTTTFLAMYDMLRNANNVSFQSIIDRQHQLGGLNLLSIPPSEDWKHVYFLERAAFLRNFYQYCLEQRSFQIPWSEWSSAHATAG